MRPIVLLGGIHDGLELELAADKRTIVLYEIRTLNPIELIPTEMINKGYPTVEEDLVTYSDTGMKNKEGRWIFQII